MSTYQRCCRRDRDVDKKAPFSCVRPSDTARCCACPEDTRQFHSETEDSARSVLEQTHLEMLACRALGRPDRSVGAAEHATPSHPPAAVLPDSSSCAPACSGRDVKRPRHCWGEQGRGRLPLERNWGLFERRHLESLGGTRPGRRHGTRCPRYQQRCALWGDYDVARSFTDARHSGRRRDRTARCTGEASTRRACWSEPSCAAGQSDDVSLSGCSRACTRSASEGSAACTAGGRRS